MNEIIILAGGKGARMKSEKPKVLTELQGRTFIERVVEAARVINPKPVVVVGYKGEEVMRVLGDSCWYTWQHEQRGTGHAVQCALLELRQTAGNIVVVPGDHPLIEREALANMLKSHEESHASLTITTVVVPNFEDPYSMFSAYGRIVRDQLGKVAAIVEIKDATPEQRAIRELNVGYYVFDAAWLRAHIDALEDNNIAGEYYLTDLVKIACSENEYINHVVLDDIKMGMGVNTLEDFTAVDTFSTSSLGYKSGTE